MADHLENYRASVRAAIAEATAGQVHISAVRGPGAGNAAQNSVIAKTLELLGTAQLTLHKEVIPQAEVAKTKAGLGMSQFIEATQRTEDEQLRRARPALGKMGMDIDTANGNLYYAGTKVDTAKSDADAAAIGLGKAAVSIDIAIKQLINYLQTI